MMHGDVRVRGFLCLVSAALLSAGPAAAADGLWSGGLEAGVTSRTAAGDLFTVAGHLERSLSPIFSVGPAVWIAPEGEASEWGVAAHARVRWNLEDMDYPPFSVIGILGLGYVDAHADADPGASLPEDDDSGLYVPIGMGLQYAVMSRLAVGGTVEFRFHTLELQGREDEASLAFLFGLQWLP
jgi:hypothetical protein